MRASRARQRGATLVISIVMLVVITLFVISAIKLSNVNLRIVGNYQWQKQMEVLTDSAIEQVISLVGSFSATAATADICQNGTVVAAGSCDALTNPKVGSVTAPQCSASRVATGYTKKLGEIAPEDNDWIITAATEDSVSRAKVTIQRGVTVRMLAGNCPP